MNGDELTSALLEAAVPPIPARLAEPPLARIRRRARNRQLAVIGSAAAMVLVLGLAFTAAVNRWPSSAPPGIGSVIPSAEPSTSDSRRPVPWQIVRVDRAGTGLKVYVEPPPGECQVYDDFSAGLDQGDDAVSITVSATAGPGTDCSRAFVATPLPMELTKPLGTRSVRDGNTPRQVFLDQDLPVIPAPWQEAPEDYSSFDGPWWEVGYTRPGGPDLRIQARAGTVTEAPVKQVTLGQRTGITFHDGPRVGVQWQVGSLVYTIDLIAGEGTVATLGQLDQVLSELTWSQ